MSVVDCRGAELGRIGGVLVLSDTTKLYKAKCPGHVYSARMHSQSSVREQKVQKRARICGSVAKSCLTLWDAMDCRTPGFPVPIYKNSICNKASFQISRLRLAYSKKCIKKRGYLGFPGDSDGKESACNSGDWGIEPGRSFGEANGYPLPVS